LEYKWITTTMMGYAFMWFVVAAAVASFAFGEGSFEYYEEAQTHAHQEQSAINVHAQSRLRPLKANKVPRIVPNNERKLENGTTEDPAFSDAFSIPFRLIWKMAFSEDTILEEPTDEEYNGLFYATLSWLLASANKVYANETLFQVHSFDMTYFGAFFNASDQYPSTVAMECQCILHADNETDVPPLLDFLFTISAQYNRTIFLQDYLALQPDVGIFREVEELRYNIIPSRLAVIVPSSTEEDVEIEILSMTLEFLFDAASGVPQQEPASDNYDAYLEATSQWLTDVLVRAYPGQNDTQPVFLNLSSSMEATVDEPSANVTSYAIQIHTDISFQVPSSGTVALPTAHDLLKLLEIQDLMNYGHFIQTAQPELGLLTGIRVVSWHYLELSYGPWVKS
jgi:hypothetical protein